MATKGVKIGVRGLRARNTQYITLRSIKPHAPGVSPVSERVQVSLQGYLVVPASNVTVEQAVIRKETDLGGDYLGQVVYVQKKEEGAEYRTLGHPRVNWGLTGGCPTD